MNKVAIVIMVIAAIGMFFGLAKQKQGKLWGRPMAVVCAIVALLCALSHIVSSRSPSMATVLDREMGYQKISGQKLGMLLAEKHNGAKAIIIVQPSLSKDAASRPNAVVEGIKEGLGSKVTVVAEVAPTIPESAKKQFMTEMPPPPGQEGGPGAPGGDPAEVVPPMEFWFTAELFDALVAKYKGQIDMVITTIGLPQEPGAMTFWNLQPRPKLAITGGSVYKLKKAIKSGAVVAAVTYNPKAVYDEKPPPSDLDKAFDKRFLLITPENLDKIAAEYGEVFGN